MFTAAQNISIVIFLNSDLIHQYILRNSKERYLIKNYQPHSYCCITKFTDKYNGYFNTLFKYISAKVSRKSFALQANEIQQVFHWSGKPDFVA